MPTRAPLLRLLLGVLLAAGGVLVVIGGLALWGPGLVGVGVAGGVSAALAAGVTRESFGRTRAAALGAAWQAAAWTVAGILAVAGVNAVAGAVVATILTLTAVVVGAGLAVHLVRQRKRGPVDGGAPVRAARATAGVAPLPPVSALTTAALGQEWLRSTAALARRLPPSARAAIVRRRQEALDELERRDPLGFARWIAAGPVPGSDPAVFVRRDVRGEAAGTDAAGTDAA